MYFFFKGNKKREDEENTLWEWVKDGGCPFEVGRKDTLFFSDSTLFSNTLASFKIQYTAKGDKFGSRGYDSEVKRDRKRRATFGSMIIVNFN